MKNPIRKNLHAAIVAALAICSFSLHAADATPPQPSADGIPLRPLPAPPADTVPAIDGHDRLSGTAPNPTGTTVGRYIDDATITTRVKARFARNTAVSVTSIKVETVQGTVQLSGFVKSADEKTRAGELARNVPGVVEVRNDLIIRAAGTN